MNVDKQSCERKLRSSNKKLTTNRQSISKRNTATNSHLDNLSSQTSGSSSSSQKSTSKQSIHNMQQPANLKHMSKLDSDSKCYQYDHGKCYSISEDATNMITNSHLSSSLDTTSPRQTNNEEIQINKVSNDTKLIDQAETIEVPQSNNFFFCRVGIQQPEYVENLQYPLDKYRDYADFISTPIKNKLANQVNTSDQCNMDDFLPDLALHNDDWQTRINVEIGHEYVDYYHFESARKFEFQLRHALYLTCPSILVTVPDSEGSILSIASIVNDRLSDTSSPVRVAFQVPFLKRDAYAHASSWGSQSSSPEKISSHEEGFQPMQLGDERTIDTPNLQRCESRQIQSASTTPSQKYICIDDNQNKSHWNQWDQLRKVLNLDNRIGVALTLSETLLNEDSGSINRWIGEPVRFLIVPVGLFVMTEGRSDSFRLPPRCKKFIQLIVTSTSMKTNIILDISHDQGSRKDGSHYLNHLAYLQMFTDNLKLQNQDPLMEWNDKIQPPLQPLSSNLDSSTYTVFEMDPVKYIRYRDAIKLGLETIITREQNQVKKRDLVLMVLGAGRGPLVDSMLEAIDSIKDNPHSLTIFALDKNPSSFRSLRYKLYNKWRTTDKLRIHVVNADMRAWHPGVKADLIATELLGSLSDNELSPECIDGAARFTNPRTISVPQEYSSYIAPICSHKLRVALREEKLKTKRLVYDQIYVCKLSNYFSISSPQRLFRFEHMNFDEEYLKGHTNERYIKLSFWSDEDTVCHGFAGYFAAKLFGSVHISTLRGAETEGMFSWFPAFIPLEEPIAMPKMTRLDLHFWRKESSSRVWYEWAVTHPIMTKIHGQNGNDTAMSKFI